MWRQFWIFVGITVIAMTLCAIIVSYARADYIINDFATWEEVITIEGEDYIILVLKNPLLSETVFAIVEVNSYCIPYYILIGKEVRKFIFDKPVYKEVKLSKEDKRKIWTFLRMNAGIRLI